MRLEAKCIHCDGALHTMDATEKWALNGRRFAAWTCPVTDKAGTTWLAGGARPPDADWLRKQEAKKSAKAAGKPDDATKKAAVAEVKKAAAAVTEAAADARRKATADARAADKARKDAADDAKKADEARRKAEADARAADEARRKAEADARATARAARNPQEGHMADTQRSTTLVFGKRVLTDLIYKTAFPFARHLLFALARHGIGGTSATAFDEADRIAREADSSRKGSQSDELADSADDMARIMGKAVLALRITPEVWMRMYPREAAEAFAAFAASGGGVPLPDAAAGAGVLQPARTGAAGLPNVDDILAGRRLPGAAAAPAAAPSGPVIEDGGESPALQAVERGATALAGATAGSRWGTKGAAVGGVLGFLSPEIDSAVGWVANQLGLFDSGEQAAPAAAAPAPAPATPQLVPSPYGRRMDPTAYGPVIED